MRENGKTSVDSGQAVHGNVFNCPRTSSTNKTCEAGTVVNTVQKDVESLAVNMERSKLIHKISGETNVIRAKERNLLVEIPVITVAEGLTNCKNQGLWKRINKEGVNRHEIKDQEPIDLPKKRKKEQEDYGLNGSKKHCELTLFASEEDDGRLVSVGLDQPRQMP